MSSDKKTITFLFEDLSTVDIAFDISLENNLRMATLLGSWTEPHLANSKDDFICHMWRRVSAWPQAEKLGGSIFEMTAKSVRAEHRATMLSVRAPEKWKDFVRSQRLELLGELLTTHSLLSVAAWNERHETRQYSLALRTAMGGAIQNLAETSAVLKHFEIQYPNEFHSETALLPSSREVTDADKGADEEVPKLLRKLRLDLMSS